MAYSYNKSKSGFLFVFLSLCLSIHSAISFPTVSSSNSNPISRMCVDDSSGKPLFCRRVHIRWKQQHHRRLLLTNRLWSSARTDESNDSNDNDGDISTNRKAVASPLTVAAYAFTLYRQYTDLCRRRPFLTSSITAGVLAAAGDVLSQSIAAGHGLFLISTTSTATTSSYAAFNWVRWRTFLLTGLLFEGPWVCFWYQGLWKMGRWMERNFQAKSRLQVVAQTVLDQTVGVSIFFPLYFLVYEVIGATVSGQVPDLRAAWTICRAELPAVLLTQYKVWPAVNFINFTYVPEPLRVLVSGVVALFWNIYLTAKVAGGTM